LILSIYRRLSDDKPNPCVTVVFAGKHSEEAMRAFHRWAEQLLDVPSRNLLTNSNHPSEVICSREDW
jgi:hypothetical protein